MPSVEERFWSKVNKTETCSSSVFNLDNGQMLSVIEPAHHETDSNCVFSTCLEAKNLIVDSEVHVHGDTSVECLIWSMLIVPVDVERNLATDSARENCLAYG